MKDCGRDIGDIPLRGPTDCPVCGGDYAMLGATNCTCASRNCEVYVIFFQWNAVCMVRDRKGNGHLTVGYSPYVDLRFMTELKEMALGESPTVNISFESSSSEETVFHVDHRDWDCGIIILPVDAPHLDIVPLFRLPLAAAMQKTHRLAKRRALRLEDLQNERLILGGKRFDLQFRGWLLSRFSDAGITPRIAAEAASPHEAQYLVTRGTGIALANSGAFRTSPEGVVVRLFPSELVQTQTAIVLRKERHSSVIGAFVNRVVQMAETRGRTRLPVCPYVSCFQAGSQVFLSRLGCSLLSTKWSSWVGSIHRRKKKRRSAGEHSAENTAVRALQLPPYLAPSAWP